jgi:hypothetical protein
MRGLRLWEASAEHVVVDAGSAGRLGVDVGEVTAGLHRHSPSFEIGSWQRPYGRNLRRQGRGKRIPAPGDRTTLPTLVAYLSLYSPVHTRMRSTSCN